MIFPKDLILMAKQKKKKAPTIKYFLKIKNIKIFI